MDAIVGAILCEVIDNNRGDDSTRQMVSASAFFLRHQRSSTNWNGSTSGTHGHFYARPQKATCSETDFWRGCIGRDNAHNDLFISRSILHGKCA